MLPCSLIVRVNWMYCKKENLCSIRNKIHEFNQRELVCILSLTNYIWFWAKYWGFLGPKKGYRASVLNYRAHFSESFCMNQLLRLHIICYSAFAINTSFEVSTKCDDSESDWGKECFKSKEEVLQTYTSYRLEVKTTFFQKHLLHTALKKRDSWNHSWNEYALNF